MKGPGRACGAGGAGRPWEGRGGGGGGGAVAQPLSHLCRICSLINGTRSFARCRTAQPARTARVRTTPPATRPRGNASPSHARVGARTPARKHAGVPPSARGAGRARVPCAPRSRQAAPAMALATYLEEETARPRGAFSQSPTSRTRPWSPPQSPRASNERCLGPVLTVLGLGSINRNVFFPLLPCLLGPN